MNMDVSPTVGAWRPSGPASLTEKEKIVLALIVEGLTYPEIARHLNRHLGTISRRVTRIFSKTGARCRGDLVYWVDNGFL